MMMISSETLQGIRINGKWLAWRSTRTGERAAALIPGVVATALARLPLPRRMRWSDREFEFIRPVHWVALLLGEEVIEAEILGVRTGSATRGHRFHHPEAIALRRPADYAGVLRDPGHVIADFDARVESIRAQAGEAAAAAGGQVQTDEVLLEEVAALVEWPLALRGDFDPEFLALPDPVLAATMKGHQRCFPIADAQGRLLPHFVAVANIESRNPDTVREGNERVIRPRLRDAEFFYREDLKKSLDDRSDELRGMVFQEGLGTLHDKSVRVSRLAGEVAAAMGLSEESVRLARRAGLLCKCDLVTEVVGEFPELQGVMGGEYARRSGESEAVADAIGEHYLPAFAGDALPATPIGRALAISDRVDSLVGLFSIGQAPSGDRDPFGLRRAALGVLRILIEGRIDSDLTVLLSAAAAGYSDMAALAPTTPIQAAPSSGPAGADTLNRVAEFIVERLRTWYAGQGVPASVFAAVHACRPARPLDFDRRIQAVDAFRRLPEAESLSAANKRIGNILRQAGHATTTPRRPARDPAVEYPVDYMHSTDMAAGRVDESMLEDGAERELYDRLGNLSPKVEERLKAGDYGATMHLLATLRDSVDAFFDAVLVMTDDEAVRANRLALLGRIRSLFLETADISLLQD